MNRMRRWSLVGWPFGKQNRILNGQTHIEFNGYWLTLSLVVLVFASIFYSLRTWKQEINAKPCIMCWLCMRSNKTYELTMPSIEMNNNSTKRLIVWPVFCIYASPNIEQWYGVWSLVEMRYAEPSITYFK